MNTECGTSLASRHRHAMTVASSPKDRESVTRNLWYQRYRCVRVAAQAGIMEPSSDSVFYADDDIGFTVAKVIESRQQC